MVSAMSFSVLSYPLNIKGSSTIQLMDHPVQSILSSSRTTKSTSGVTSLMSQLVPEMAAMDLSEEDEDAAPSLDEPAFAASCSIFRFDTGKKENYYYKHLVTTDFAFRRSLFQACTQFLLATFPSTRLTRVLLTRPFAWVLAVLHVATRIGTLAAVLTTDGYLFVHVPEHLAVQDATELRRFVVMLLELAEDQLGCRQLVMCLSPKERVLTKALVFVGFDVVSSEVMGYDPERVHILAYSI